jgi:hypothetical protein
MEVSVEPAVEAAHFAHEVVVSELWAEISSMKEQRDLAGLFDVRAHRRIRQGSIHTLCNEKKTRITTRHANGESERPPVRDVSKNDSPPEFATGGILFRIEPALGSLRALTVLQADTYDDHRDVTSGNIEHGVRHEDSTFRTRRVLLLPNASNGHERARAAVPDDRNWLKSTSTPGDCHPGVSTARPRS